MVDLARLAERACGSGGRIEVTAPATGATAGSVPGATPADVAAAAVRGRAAQRAWAARPFAERAAILLRFHDLVLRRREEALHVVALETGKARADVFEEVFDTANVARYYARTGARHLASRRRHGALPLLTWTVEHRRPLGLVGFVVPWNYPLVLGVTDALPALMAGNAALVKPDVKTPFSALWAASLLDEAGLDPALMQVVVGTGEELGTPVIEQVDYVMFTGSTRVGRLVARQCGERLIGCSLELGGKNAMIVLDDADEARAAAGARRACFNNAGQLCISMERVFLPERRFDALADAIAAQARAIRLAVDMGSLQSAEQLATVEEHVADAVAKGATVLAGGRARPDVGPLYHEPTVLTGVTPAMTLHAEETFGPVVSLYPYRDDDDAVRQANASAYGLNFSVFTEDAARGRRLARRLEAGTVNVNEGYAATWASTDAPMGGFKDSGVGRRHGAEGIRKYTAAQTVSVQRLLPLDAPPRVGQRTWERSVVVSLRLLRRLPLSR